MRTDPGKQFERALPISLLQLSLGVSCHASLGEGINSVLNDSTLAVGYRFLRAMKCVRASVHDYWFEPRCERSSNGLAGLRRARKFMRRLEKTSVTI